MVVQDRPELPGPRDIARRVVFLEERVHATSVRLAWERAGRFARDILAGCVDNEGAGVIVRGSYRAELANPGDSHYLRGCCRNLVRLSPFTVGVHGADLVVVRPTVDKARIEVGAHITERHEEHSAP